MIDLRDSIVRARPVEPDDGKVEKAVVVIVAPTGAATEHPLEVCANITERSIAVVAKNARAQKKVQEPIAVVVAPGFASKTPDGQSGVRRREHAMVVSIYVSEVKVVQARR